MRPRAKLEKMKSSAAFTDMNMLKKNSKEMQLLSPRVPLAMQSAAAASAAREGADISSSSDSDSFDSSDAVSLRFTSDSDYEEFLVPELESNEMETAWARACFFLIYKQTTETKHSYTIISFGLSMYRMLSIRMYF